MSAMKESWFGILLVSTCLLRGGGGVVEGGYLPNTSTIAL